MKTRTAIGAEVEYGDDGQGKPSVLLSGRLAVVEEVRCIASVQPIPAIVAALQALRDRPDAGPTLANIKVPTLVVVGSEDALTPPAMAEKLVAGIRGAGLEVIRGAGH